VDAGRARVGDGIAAVSVGKIGAVGEATAVNVFVGSATVFVGSDVWRGWMRTSNCPQAARDNRTTKIRTLSAFIRPLLYDTSLSIL
jgi:hypothetical protein